MSCVDLPLIDPEACGNRVVEPAFGEDCDGEAGCAAPGADNACLYVCDKAHGKPCPAGYGCGVDGVCRRPSGKIVRVATMSTVTTVDMMVGDTNADGCQDLVRTTLEGTTVTALDSHAPGLCAARERLMGSRLPPPNQRPYPSPLLAEVTGNARPELLLSGAGLSAAGLFVYSSDGSASLEPLLVPSLDLPSPGVRPLTVNIHGTDELLLLLGDAPIPQDGGGGGMMPPPMGCGGGPPPPKMDGTTQVALLESRDLKPALFNDALPFGLNSVVAVRAADLDGDGCDDVIVALSGDTRLRLYSLCKPALHLTPLPSPEIMLDGGTKLRTRNAAIVVADMNDDQHLDVLTNTDGCTIQIAYGDGGGRFNSVPLPPGGMPDQKTSTLPILDPMLSSMLGTPDSIFIAGKFDDTKVGLQLAGVQCPPSPTPFQSEVCSPIPGECEAVAVDIDKDGLDDIVASKGQQPGLIVGRAAQGGHGFHFSTIDTQCPAHNLATGDFDDDGVGDVAFFDQIASLVDQPSTALRIAYGNAYAPPTEPEGYARFPQAMGLCAGRFGGAMAGQELFAARRLSSASALALAEGNAGRQTLAPFYFPDTNPNDKDSLLKLDLLATAGGHFTLDEKNQPRGGVAVMTLDPNDKGPSMGTAVWLLEPLSTAENNVNAVPSSATLPACSACVLASANVDGAGADELLLFGDQSLIVYTAGAGGFSEQRRFPTAHGFHAYDDSNPRRFAQRPLVADIDGDGHVDVVLRATSGALVAFWGAGDGSFEEVEFSGPVDPKTNKPVCAGQAAALINLDEDPAREVVVIGPGELSVCALDTKTRTLTPKTGIALPITAPDPKTDFTAIAAGDLDGDGVDDLAVMTSGSLIDILRGIPVHE